MPPNSPPISVLLPVYKEPFQWIALSIESILHQTWTNFELLILVDHPTNKKLIAFLEKYKKDKRVQLFINTENEGLAKILNKGIALAKGRYIARMDADDIALPYRLEKQYQFMKENPHIDLCGTQVLKIDEEGKAVACANNYTEERLLQKLIPYSNVIAHSTWFIKKKIFEKVGGYRNLSPAEDYNLVSRIIDAGYKVSNLKEVLLKWRIHTTGLTGSASVTQKTGFVYIKELHKERMQTGKDSYSDDEMKSRVKANQLKYGAQQAKAQAYLIQFYQKKSAGKWLSAFYYLWLSFWVSSIQRNYYIDLLKAKWIVFWYKLNGLLKA